MIYASVDPATLNTDPAPWQALAGGDRGARCDENVRPSFERLGIKYRHNPRPEYTPATAHLANPILVAFRQHYPEQSARAWLRVLLMPNARRAFWLGEDYPLSQIDHAERVLTRLANWKEGNR